MTDTVIIMGESAKRNGPVGFGGWLIIVAIGLVISPFYQLAQLFEVLLSDIIKSLLIKPEFLARDPFWPFGYHAWWKPLLIFDLLTGVVIIMLSALLAVLFFRRSRHFPLLFIVTSCIAVASQFVSAWLLSSIAWIPMLDLVDRDTISGLAPWCVWIPYMLRSKRVKNTFV